MLWYYFQNSFRFSFSVKLTRPSGSRSRSDQYRKSTVSYLKGSVKDPASPQAIKKEMGVLLEFEIERGN